MLCTECQKGQTVAPRSLNEVAVSVTEDRLGSQFGSRITTEEPARSSVCKYSVGVSEASPSVDGVLEGSPFGVE